MDAGFNKLLVTAFHDGPNAYDEPKITVKYDGIFYIRIYVSGKFEYNHKDIEFVEKLIEFAKTVDKKQISKNYRASGDAEKFLMGLAGTIDKFKNMGEVK